MDNEQKVSIIKIDDESVLNIVEAYENKRRIRIFLVLMILIFSIILSIKLKND